MFFSTGTTAARAVRHDQARGIDIIRTSLLLLRLVIGAMLLGAVSVAVSRPGKEPASNVSGHYYLQGVMETGSELELDPTGRFQWYLAYGALDLYARGRWSQAGDSITLVSEPVEGLPDPSFDTLTLRRDADGGLVPQGKSGIYVRSNSD